MEKALWQLLENINIPNEQLTIQIDGNDKYQLHREITATSIIRWDAKVKQISAASIIAKVTRDHCMIKYGQEFPEYGFEMHKW
jgi:ribonuclease HII